jgi:hypothetical protein
VQERVDAAERVELAEALLDLLPQDRAVVRRQAFLRRRPRVEHGPELLLLLRVEPGGGSGLLEGPQGV